MIIFIMAIFGYISNVRAIIAYCTKAVIKIKVCMSGRDHSGDSC